MIKLNPRVDFAFKKLFGSEENKDLLKSFVNSVLGEEDQVEELELKNPYTLKNFAHDKFSIFDIKAVDKKGRHINIEMQITDQLDYDKRVLYSWSKLYSGQMTEGARYSTLNKAIGIHVLNFNLLEGPEYHNVFGVMNKNSQKPAFTDLQLHTVELKKFDRDLDHLITQLDRWVMFLNRSHEFGKNKVPKQLENDQKVTKAIDVLETAYLTDEERVVYEDHKMWLMDEEEAIRTAEIRGMERGMEDGMEKGKKEGLQEGMEKGREQERQEVARKMKLAGLPLDQISAITGYSPDEIQLL